MSLMACLTEDMATAAVMGFHSMFFHGLPTVAHTAITWSRDPLGKAVGEGAARLHYAINGHIPPLACHRAPITRIYDLGWSSDANL